jgi:hypothetical protein
MLHAAPMKAQKIKASFRIGVTPECQLRLSPSLYHRAHLAATACGYLRLTLPRAPPRE